MARRQLDLGETGEVRCVREVRLGDRWLSVGSVRDAGQAIPKGSKYRYRARAYYRGYDGIRRDAVATDVTKERAKVAVAERIAAALRGADDVTMGPATPLVSAGEAWIAQIRRSDSGLSERTVSDYERTFRRCIDAPGSTLRGLSISQANSAQRLRAFLQRVADERGSGTAKICRSVLRGILGLAVDNGVIESSAMLQVRPVKSQSPRPSDQDHTRAFTREERDQVIAYADALASPGEPLDPRTKRKRQAVADLIAMMAGTGARIEEARSLSWDAIDLDAGTCNIRGTKTESSDRLVSFPDWLCARMRRRADELGTEGLVFPSPATAGDPYRRWDQSNSARAVRQILNESGFAWAIPHTFRRTVATLLDDAGVPIRRISDQLGHKDPSMTARVYLGRDFGSDKADLAALL